MIDLTIELKEKALEISWQSLCENVATMSEANRDTITSKLRKSYNTQPLRIDAAIMGHVARPRYDWPSWDCEVLELGLEYELCKLGRMNQLERKGAREEIPMELFFDDRAEKIN